MKYLSLKKILSSILANRGSFPSERILSWTSQSLQEKYLSFVSIFNDEKDHVEPANYPPRFSGDQKEVQVSGQVGPIDSQL